MIQIILLLKKSGSDSKIAGKKNEIREAAATVKTNYLENAHYFEDDIDEDIENNNKEKNHGKPPHHADKVDKFEISGTSTAVLPRFEVHVTNKDDTGAQISNNEHNDDDILKAIYDDYDEHIIRKQSIAATAKTKFREAPTMNKEEILYEEDYNFGDEDNYRTNKRTQPSALKRWDYLPIPRIF